MIILKIMLSKMSVNCKLDLIQFLSQSDDQEQSGPYFGGPIS